MTTTYPTPASFATTRPIIFAVGTSVRIQHNTGLYKIHSHAAWSDDDHRHLAGLFIHLAAESIPTAVRCIGFKEW